MMWNENTGYGDRDEQRARLAAEEGWRDTDLRDANGFWPGHPDYNSEEDDSDE